MPKVRKTDLNPEDNLIKITDKNHIIGYINNVRSKPENKITVEDLMRKFPRVESVLEQNVVIKYNTVENEDGTITKVPKLHKNGDYVLKNTICSKANHGTSRTLPNSPQVVIKCKGFEPAYSVPVKCYYSDMKPKGLFVPNFLKPKLRIPFKEQCKIIRYLGKKQGYVELSKKTDEEISLIFKELRNRKKLERLSTTDENAKQEFIGYTQKIMDMFNLGHNRGVITDLCLWKWLLSFELSENYFSSHCREQGILVIPEELFYRFVKVMM